MSRTKELEDLMKKIQKLQIVVKEFESNSGKEIRNEDEDLLSLTRIKRNLEVMREQLTK